MIALLAVPILIQVYFNSGLAYLLNRVSGEEHCVAGPSALTGASNFFELAVAAAISLFGFNSGAALATVVGVLIEVPVMLSGSSTAARAGTSAALVMDVLPGTHKSAFTNEDGEQVLDAEGKRIV
ncbi:ACR3 family arsenite efflux pump ArsB [Rhizobium mesoamericanum]|nr:ACR3 family arsenite efflux pump ArsB [Rhizobium mesoamericanum]